MKETERPEALRFENLIKKVDANKDNSPLPNIDMAMFEEDVAFHDDLSDYKKYNPRYIELTENESVRGNFILYIFFFFHNFCLVLFVYMMLRDPGWFPFFILLGPVVAWLFMLVFSISVRGAVRFNRQAQLVHIGNISGQATTVSWRDVKPYINHGILGGDLRFFFPIPSSELEQKPESLIKDLYRDRPVMVQGHMDWRDPGFSSSLMRLEFYRRYMEKGLDAVQPDPQKVGKANIQPPSPAAQSLPEHGFLLHRVINPMQKIGIFLAGGPLIDRFLRKQAKKFYWPEEVERLCAPDADLSGLDTRPVIARKDIFYRARTMAGIEYVNARGEPVG